MEKFNPGSNELIKFFYPTIFLLLLCLSKDALAFSYERLPHGSFSWIHVLTIDPKEHVIIPARAVGRETALALANQHGAVAATNGGFWKANGDPAGALKINGEWLGTPVKPRGAIGWSLSNDQVVIDRILTNYSSEEQIEVVPFSTSPDDWSTLENIVGGAPVLVQNGHIIEDFTLEQTLPSFLTSSHPRTAVGIKENGTWVFVVVDGSAYRLFGGMSIKELAELMLDLGCIKALNLDGGGSSTMVIDGQVINEPCGKIYENDKYVESISDAILIF